MTHIPIEISAILDELRELDGVKSAYLIGSQASGKATPSSDWDILLFGTTSTLRQIQQRWPSCPHAGLDLLVVHDTDNFCSPWLEEGRTIPKSGSLTAWNWRENQERSRATYKQTKLVKGTNHIRISEALAIRLFPEEQSTYPTIINTSLET